MYLQYVYEYETLKPGEVILRRGRGKRENSGGDEPNRGTIFGNVTMNLPAQVINTNKTLKKETFNNGLLLIGRENENQVVWVYRHKQGTIYQNREII
jgi:hypothetical protein